METEMEIDSPRGTKRKAGEASLAEAGPRRIKALDQDVVNKIAAGEIIVAPVHALKELIENAVDAGSTALEVLVKEGGLKLLQITDNGHGIEKEDLPILCERFTTSKLKKFEDLGNIATYGFRGEALASISHIAHLTVTTKTKGSNCAWRAHYDGGKLAPAKPGQPAEPKPTAGRNGTQITVEDLFYNVPTRRRAFRSASEEYNKIIDMVGRYAVHCQGVAFSCKKHGDSGTSIAVQSGTSTIDRVRQIHGGSVANELIEFATSDDRYGLKAEGLATNANYHIKKTTLLLFINHRSVESSNIKKAIEQTYSTFLPKNGHPFVYLNIEIDPQRVDVNIHPTKREVNFLNEDEIVQAICENVRDKLAAVDTSRTFMTQTLLPGTVLPSDLPQPDVDGPTKKPAAKGKAPVRPYENNLVRTDASLRKITSMFQPANAESPAVEQADEMGPQYEHADREAVVCRLTSVRELRGAVRDDMHHSLTEVFAGHTFVGIVDERRRLAAMQGGVKLYLVDYGRACSEYFYQVGLTDFGNFGTIRFQPALDLREILSIAAEREKATAAEGELADDDDFDVEEVVETVAEQIIERREMLLEYFSLEVSPAGELISIPLLTKGYTPSMAKLPQFLLRLGPHVDWTDERACFGTFLRELASFYVPEQLPPLPGNAEQLEAENISDEIKSRRAHVRRAVEHVFFPAFKARLVATKSLMNGGVLELADLKGLYRVFERC
ncbi:putative DNA mismatch repair protein [Truncatella angustata]|uniref:DNA mismatch repair protein n=1 Tax=Truncatella angustata TaxID=152316 RepID=A0A9P9A3Y4_9PEZI|nr:putative DNA mismatch repair protein [Truncatella angustata]KAH6659359.1 putative DNA mismatch repair protein [Truncatella angustata]